MTQPNDVNYTLAAGFVESGQWRVDPDVGLVYGKRGLPFVRLNSWGYIQIKFRDAEDWRIEHAALAHRVIWESQHGPIAPLMTINHINGVKADNRIVNLECVTMRENAIHARRTGLNVPAQGENASTAKLTNEQALAIFRRAQAGENQSAIAKDFGCGRVTVSHINARRIYRIATDRVA